MSVRGDAVLGYDVGTGCWYDNPFYAKVFPEQNRVKRSAEDCQMSTGGFLSRSGRIARYGPLSTSAEEESLGSAVGPRPLRTLILCTPNGKFGMVVRRPTYFRARCQLSLA